MSTGILALPFPHASGAPAFAGDDDKTLLLFFDQFEALADECRLTDDEKCCSIVRYIDRWSKELWLMLSAYESCDYQKFKAEIVYQYPTACKATQRRTAQLAHCCTADEVDNPVRSTCNLATEDLVHAASDPCELTLSPLTPSFCPSLAFHRASLTARPVPKVLAPAIRCPAPRACYDHAVPATRAVHAVPGLVAHPVIPVPVPVIHSIPATAVPLVYVPPIVHHGASSVRHDHAVPAVRKDHAAPTVCRAAPHAPHVRTAAVVRPGLAVPVASGNRPAPVTYHTARTVHRVHAAPVLDHAASIFHCDNPALPQLPSCSAFMPLVLSPPSLPFPLCPMPALSASDTARPLPSPIEFKPQIIMPACREACEFVLNLGHVPVKSQDCSLPRCADKEDVAVQKEEGRGWKIDLQPNNDENKRRRAIDSQQDEHTKRESADEPGETADEEDEERIADETWTQRVVNKDQTRIADEDRLEVKHRQENVELEQQQNQHTKCLEYEIDMLSVPVSPPAPESSPELSAVLDTRIAIISLTTPEPLSCLADHRSYSLTKITPARSLVPRSQHARLSSFQHIFSQTRIPHSPLPHLRSKDRLASSQYLSSQNCPRSTHLPSQICLLCSQYLRSQIFFFRTQYQ